MAIGLMDNFYLVRFSFFSYHAYRVCISRMCNTVKRVWKVSSYLEGHTKSVLLIRGAY